MGDNREAPTFEIKYRVEGRMVHILEPIPIPIFELLQAGITQIVTRRKLNREHAQKIYGYTVTKQLRPILAFVDVNPPPPPQPLTMLPTPPPEAAPKLVVAPPPKPKQEVLPLPTVPLAPAKLSTAPPAGQLPLPKLAPKVVEQPLPPAPAQKSKLTQEVTNREQVFDEKGKLVKVIIRSTTYDENGGIVNESIAIQNY